LPYDWLLRRDLTLSEARVGLRGLPDPFVGARALLITDIHAGPFVTPRVLTGTFRRLLTLQPDLILLGGDLVTSQADEFLQHRQAFCLLRAPLGVYAVLGNHDHYSGEQERLSRLCGEAGIEVLRNRWIDLRSGRAGLTLAGVDDLVAGEPELDLALWGAPRPVVLLSHNPDLLFDAARRDVDLVLSGHTHAGQIRIPRLPVLVRQSRYRLDEGRFKTRRTELVVSRGLGVVGLPLRVACPPQAVLLTLDRKPH
jgi:predicted MPP superfamily phosphohydrolase